MMGWIFVILAPVAGGLLYGLERVIRARMQNRQGPPLLQPFYDLFKLADKRPMVLHSLHGMLGILHFIAVWLALAVLLTGGDLLMAVFIHLLASAFLVAAAFSANSIYSQLGGGRELVMMLAYEPIFILAAVGLYMATGSFQVSGMLEAPAPLMALLPLLAAVLLALPAKLKKSPFDAAEAHQEIIGGAEIEYSGIFFEALYTARWLEYLFAYAFVFLFAGANWGLGLALAAGAFLAVNLADNATARVTYGRSVKIILGIALPLAFVNLALLTMGGN